jgi:hypothetical protein
MRCPQEQSQTFGSFGVLRDRQGRLDLPEDRLGLQAYRDQHPRCQDRKVCLDLWGLGVQQDPLEQCRLYRDRQGQRERLDRQAR